MKKYIHGIEIFHAKDRHAWRNWLQKNHEKKTSVWLQYYKPNSGKARVAQSDAVEEALCFGWIDSKANKLDEVSSVQFFSRRKPKSNWSKINKNRVEKLLNEGMIVPAGLAVIEEAKRNGSWDALNEVEELILPPDLIKALEKNKKAMNYFHSFPKSSRKIILQWIYSAKQVETRKKRITETVKLAARNIRANHYRQPKKSGTG